MRKWGEVRVIRFHPFPQIFRSLLAGVNEGKIEECEDASGAMKHSHERLPAANYWARKTEVRSSQSVSLVHGHCADNYLEISCSMLYKTLPHFDHFI